MKTRNLVSTLAIALVPAVFACSDPPSAAQQQSGLGAAEGRDAPEMLTMGGQMGPGMGEPGRPIGALDPGRIVDLLLVIHTGEVAQARLALERAESPVVREFATRMLEEHTGSLERLRSSEVGRMRSGRDMTAVMMARQDELMTRHLEAQPPGLFDAAYIANQIGAHAKALGLITGALIPALQQMPMQGGAPEADPLVRELAQSHTMIADHLQHALLVQAQLGSPAGAPPMQGPTEPMQVPGQTD